MKWNHSDLRSFLEVAKTLNISRAAERLGIGQPALSQCIQRLETYFGVPLLNRYKTGVRLTTAGERLVASGHITLEVCDKLKEQVIASETLIQGHFTIGAHHSVAIYALPTFLADLLKEYADLSIGLVHGLSREVLEAVISFRVDFGIIVNPVMHPDLVIKVLCHDQIKFWYAPGTIKDVLIYDPHLIQVQNLISKLPATYFKRKIASSNLDVVAACAAAGAGIAILPTRVAQKFKNLQPFNEKNLSHFDDKICLVYRADRHISAAGRLIIDKIRKINL